VREGVRLCARFSLATSALSYCGPRGADELLRRAAARSEGLDEAGAALMRFEALAPYLGALARKWNMRPLDYPVVEAYWVGNALLDGFGPDDFREVLAELARRGLPARFAHALEARLPQDPLPHHAFHVMFVGVGRVTGKVATTLRHMDACRPSWGTVLRREHGRALVLRQPLAMRGSRLALGAPRREYIEFEPWQRREVRPGATVALHWGRAAVRLGREERAHLELATLRSIEAANEAAEGGALHVEGGARHAEAAATA
jgi:hypothetical protein